MGGGLNQQKRTSTLTPLQTVTNVPTANPIYQTTIRQQPSAIARPTVQTAYSVLLRRRRARRPRRGVIVTYLASGSWLTAMAHLLVRIAVVAADWARGSLPEISGETRMHHMVKCAFRALWVRRAGERVQIAGMRACAGA